MTMKQIRNRKNIKEESYHIENKEESLTKPETLSTMIEQEIEQLTTIKLVVDITRKEAEPQEEENEEDMLPEDGVLLTYVLKQNLEDNEIKSVDTSTKPEAEISKEDVDYTSGKLQVSSNSHKISRNS